MVAESLFRIAPNPVDLPGGFRNVIYPLEMVLLVGIRKIIILAFHRLRDSRDRRWRRGRWWLVALISRVLWLLNATTVVQFEFHTSEYFYTGSISGFYDSRYQ
jgi:hypothetical protein